jgi:tRNA pseudouridine38-40 synthase
MIGYAGSGYKGMQINAQEKTIEGDIFKAFVAAGAISKANADDPKKSSLVRCARTDKGVHAAGNVISLKLIVEDPEIIQKINDNLPPQIRVWGLERTNGSFSCYQTCDSRWYEYLIPTYSFIPPHPQSFLGKKLVESAEKEGVFESYQARQEDAASFWKKAEEKYVKPILDNLEPEMRETVMAVVHSSEEVAEEVGAIKKAMKQQYKQAAKPVAGAEMGSKPTRPAAVGSEQPQDDPAETDAEKMDDVVESEENKSTEELKDEVEAAASKKRRAEAAEEEEERSSKKRRADAEEDAMTLLPEVDDGKTASDGPEDKQEATATAEDGTSKSVLTPFEAAIKEVKAAYIVAKKAYRVSQYRRDRVQEALDCYLGTRNFHNYTIQKSFSDPSAKRVIRSFKVGPEPVIINDTEWLSLKVHGQSFMMHQIRKMIAMAALVVRCGSPKEIIAESFGSPNISIPKAPGLGLLLERPIFDNYNERAVREFGREKIDFDKYQMEMDEFKQREIYDRIFREEEKDHQYDSPRLRC